MSPANPARKRAPSARARGVSTVLRKAQNALAKGPRLRIKWSNAARRILTSESISADRIRVKRGSPAPKIGDLVFISNAGIDGGKNRAYFGVIKDMTAHVPPSPIFIITHELKDGVYRKRGYFQETWQGYACEPAVVTPK